MIMTWPNPLNIKITGRFERPLSSPIKHVLVHVLNINEMIRSSGILTIIMLCMTKIFFTGQR